MVKNANQTYDLSDHFAIYMNMKLLGCTFETNKTLNVKLYRNLKKRIELIRIRAGERMLGWEFGDQGLTQLHYLNLNYLSLFKSLNFSIKSLNPYPCQMALLVLVLAFILNVN